jgi:SAM-dependent methyltransferase
VERVAQLYDTIGAGYSVRRRADHRIAAAITRALHGADSVVNVGAGAGSYEPTDGRVVAVEPAWSMILQRPPQAAPIVQGSAISLPFRDRAFDAALALLTVHHWPDRPRGLAELARVARGRIVVLTWDPAASGFWLVDDYFPEIPAIDRQIFPSLADFDHAWGPIDVIPVPVPHDCTDGFLGAYWRRPTSYLDPTIRLGISTFSKVPNVEPGLERLRTDLEDGTWHQRHGHLLKQTELDLGYRLIIGRPSE